MFRPLGEFSASAKGCGTTAVDLKLTQQMLNQVGATDADGKALVADGSWGARSQAAFDKYAAHFTANKNAFAAFGVALTPCDALKFEAGCAASGLAAPAPCSKVPAFSGRAAAASAPPSDAPPVAGPTSQFFEIQRWQQYLNKKGCQVNEQGLWDDKTDAASKLVLAGKSCAPASAVAPPDAPPKAATTSSRLGSRRAFSALQQAFAKQPPVSPKTGQPVPVRASVGPDGTITVVSGPSKEPSAVTAAEPAAAEAGEKEETDTKMLVIGGLALAALAAGGIFLATRKKA